MKRKPRPPAPDMRQPWQIEQAARCGCRGTDDLCACQNEQAPWRYGMGAPPPTELQMAQRRIRELEGEVSTLSLQQQTDRETTASLLTAPPTVQAALLSGTERSEREATPDPPRKAEQGAIERLTDDKAARNLRICQRALTDANAKATEQAAEAKHLRECMNHYKGTLARVEARHAGNPDWQNIKAPPHPAEATVTEQAAEIERLRREVGLGDMRASYDALMEMHHLRLIDLRATEAERDALAKRVGAGAAMIDQAAVKAAVALQVRLAMQSEMMSPDHLRVQRRTKRAEEAADAILSHLALTPPEPTIDASRQSGGEA
jgi:hypothetical protein